MKGTSSSCHGLILECFHWKSLKSILKKQAVGHYSLACQLAELNLGQKVIHWFGVQLRLEAGIQKDL